ncbi:GNAT family N-acetyltransferase [Sphingomonas sp. AX6]|uniref:GNAT family N-acetyltransferase n=1 Tax=Sphingomonas sp. AX6 TaxID=2653171 RepID=UPI0012F1B275|nr:GNAT family N-acetyltransferase [Sphingomonas sp. AX6]VXC82206.1 Ribosomal protein S18 acetylase RimI [Sphingomonas sp. AX6]
MMYRDATPADAAAIAELARVSFTETFGHLYTPENLAAFLTSHTTEDWARVLADPDVAVRVAENDGALIGYARVGPPTLPIEPHERAVELRQFYLLKPWHGGGHAQTLMDWVIATARANGADALFLSVFVDNVRAQRFYARYGFEDVGRYAFMVGSHEDEDRLMRLAL